MKNPLYRKLAVIYFTALVMMSGSAVMALAVNRGRGVTWRLARPQGGTALTI